MIGWARTLLRAGPVAGTIDFAGGAAEIDCPAPPARSAFAVGRLLLAVLALGAAFVAGGCGADYPDTLLLTRGGTLPGARLSLLVNDGGTVSCNGGEARQLPPELLIDAREIARDLAEEAHDDLVLVAPRGSLLRYRVRTQDGTVVFSDANAVRRPELGRVVAFARTVAKDVCGLAR